MNSEILGFLAEAAVHPGVGEGEGAVDLPIAREEPMDHPHIPDSGVKGGLREKAWRMAFDGKLSSTGTLQQAIALADEGKLGRDQVEEWASREAEKQTDMVFGSTNEAGLLAVPDARLLLLPVRSLTSAYRWVTCPYLLERFDRDMIRAGLASSLPNPLPAVAEDEALVMQDEPVFLEELDFKPHLDERAMTALVRAFEPLIDHPGTSTRLREQFALVDDNVFSHLARTAPPVTPRNSLDHRKRSQNLFYEETLPADTVMYVLINERVGGALEQLDALLPSADPYLRLGGNETLGQGWFRVTRPWRRQPQASDNTTISTVESASRDDGTVDR